MMRCSSLADTGCRQGERYLDHATYSEFVEAGFTTYISSVSTVSTVYSMDDQ